MGDMSERYEIGDKVCGVIRYAASYIQAWGIAGLLAVSSHRACGDLTIYDRMAHRGKPEMWTHDGRCISIKGTMNYSYKLTCLLCGTTPEHLTPVDHDDLARLQENLENLMRLQKHIKKEHGFSEQDLQKAVCHTAYLWKKPDEEGYYMQAIELPT